MYKGDFDFHILTALPLGLHSTGTRCKESQVVQTLMLYLITCASNNQSILGVNMDQRACFAKAPKRLGPISSAKLRNPLGFSDIKKNNIYINKKKKKHVKISGWYFDNWHFGPEKFLGLSRTKPQDRVVRSRVSAKPH